MQSPPENSSSGTANELKSDVQQVASSAGNRLHGELDSRKDSAATQARSVSSAIDRAAHELDGSPQWIRSAFQQAAQQVQRFADTLENKDSRQLMSDVRNFARDNPGTFLAGCAAAGFAAARVFKAGSPDTGPQGSFGGQGSQGFQSRAPDVTEPGGFQATSDLETSASSGSGTQSGLGTGFGTGAGPDPSVPPTSRGEFV